MTPIVKSRRGASMEPMSGFLPYVAEWFAEHVGKPTAPQTEAWPHIQSGENVLIHSPTGTGKTLAAFLSAINDLFERPPAKQSSVRVLYISPLKALNNDIDRNLRAPLSGIRQTAQAFGELAPEIRTAVRTGDTTPSARAAMVRTPPDILITTPESLYLILTSPKARDILRNVESLIVDEIHTVSDNKRGTHLALSMERLEQISPGYQRIGLSATQRPVEEVARFLGGQNVDWVDGRPVATPRPVSIVDVDYQKEIVVNVYGMAESAAASPTSSIWPNLIPRVLKDILQHDTTLVFANSRRQAERTADRLNAQLKVEDAAELGRELVIDPDSFTGGLFSTGHGEGPFRAHHSSISDEQRREMERDLKSGELPALIGTSSLELGIDIGSIDLVVQLQSPGSVTQALQRIGRSGHSVGVPSVGKIYATHQEDLFESALVARGIMERDVEEIHVPRNPLDVLSQQVIATVSVEDWTVRDLYSLVLSAYPYVDLEMASFESVLRLVSGRYPSTLARSLRARVYWDETSGTLSALPGARLLALSNGGAIVDRGLFGVYLPDRKTRIGELDEEFVFETTEGDAFFLGSQVWRAREIDDDRVIVEPAPGAMPRMPFWRGEYPWRPYALSKKLADFRAELAHQMMPYVDDDEDPKAVIDWLRSEYRVDEAGARQLVGYVRRQLHSTGTISSSDSIVLETYTDPIGDRRMVVQSPFGGRVNAPWSIALASVLEEVTGVEPEVQVGDDGILFRFPESDGELPVDVISETTAQEARSRLLDHLADSALFGAVFRKSAYRALLLPGSGRGRRTPFWLQRLRAKDLLSITRGFPDFPIILETYRDCLEDAMDLPHLEEVIDAIQSGEINIVHVDSDFPSPVAQGLNWEFENFYLYEWDAPKAERSMQSLQLDRSALARLFKDPSFAGTLREEAVSEVVAETAKLVPGYKARSAIELAQVLIEQGDLKEDEISASCNGDWRSWLTELDSDGRAVEITIPSQHGPESRWVATLDREIVSTALQADTPTEELLGLLRRFAARRGPFTVNQVTERYGIDTAVAQAALESLAVRDVLIEGYFSPDASELEWADAQTVTRAQRRTLAIHRAEISPVSRLRFAASVAQRQALARSEDAPADEPDLVLNTLRGLAAPISEWQSIILPSRLPLSSQDVERLFADGDFAWVVEPSDSATPSVRIFPRTMGRSFLSGSLIQAITAESQSMTGVSARLWEFISSEGVTTSADIRSAMSGISLMALRQAIRGLVFRGLLTGDSWSALQAIARNIPETGSPDRRGPSSNEQRRQAARSIREASAALPPDATWSITSRHAVLGPPVSDSERARAQADALLDRYGVVSRAVLEWETSPWDWGQIVAELNLDELRGRVRRGYFVEGLPGLQFARSQDVDALRSPPNPDSIAIVNGRDPANILDRSMADEFTPETARFIRFNRVESTTYAFAGERPVFLSEDNGARLVYDEDPEVQETASRALERFVQQQMNSIASINRIEITTWNGSPVLETDGVATLEAIGFRREFPRMTYDALQARLSNSPSAT